MGGPGSTTQAFCQSATTSAVTVCVALHSTEQQPAFISSPARPCELWIGDAAEVRAKRVRKQKTDRQDAQHILKLMLKDDFPQIWVAIWENLDLRQLLRHRHRMVQTTIARCG